MSNPKYWLVRYEQVELEAEITTAGVLADNESFRRQEHRGERVTLIQAELTVEIMLVGVDHKLTVIKDV